MCMQITCTILQFEKVMERYEQDKNVVFNIVFERYEKNVLLQLLQYSSTYVK